MYYEPKYSPNHRRRRRRRRNYAPVVLLALAICLLGGILFGVCRILRGSGEEISFTTNPDSTPPVITGVRDFLIYEGDSIHYRQGVEVTDETDEAPKFWVDAGAVDPAKAGTYTVIYTAADAAGNITTASAQVTVLEKKVGYEDLTTIYALADELLEEILGNQTDPEEQVKLIYRWARSRLVYVSGSDHTDWHQTAYQTMRSGKGDCFGYFAVTKLMFERLGISNLDVRKVKNDPDDSDHFWSLVSVDGGSHYYHFDATPRVGKGDDFCLVSDAFLDAYSREHKNSHNRDTSLYPATPKENLT